MKNCDPLLSGPAFAIDITPVNRKLRKKASMEILVVCLPDLKASTLDATHLSLVLGMSSTLTRASVL